MPSIFTGLLASSLICSIFVAIHLLNSFVAIRLLNLLYETDICLETSTVMSVSMNNFLLVRDRRRCLISGLYTDRTNNKILKMQKQVLLQQCFWCGKLLFFCGSRTTEEYLFFLKVISKSKLRNPSRALWHLINVLLIH